MIKTLLLSVSCFAVTACADDGTAGEPAPDGFIELSAAELAAASVDDGAGGVTPLVLPDGAHAYLAIDQDADADAPDPAGASATTAPCGYIVTGWDSTLVAHAGQICLRGGGCTPMTFYLYEEVECERFCNGGYGCTAIHSNGSRHVTTTPTTPEDAVCEYACNPFSECEGCVLF